MTNTVKWIVFLLLVPAVAAMASPGKKFPYDTEKLPNAIDWKQIKSDAIPEIVTYEVQSGDTLAKIAKKFRTTAAMLKRLNDLKTVNIYAGQELKVWNAPFTILVLKPRNLLVLKTDKRILKAYMVSTGKTSTMTPSGTYTIKLKLVDPVWYHDGKAFPPGDPENGLGTRWLGFDLDSYGIHGTIHPEHIGQSVSSGCVRMYNADVEELFDLVPEGTRVIIN